MLPGTPLPVELQAESFLLLGEGRCLQAPEGGWGVGLAGQGLLTPRLPVDLLPPVPHRPCLCDP